MSSQPLPTGRSVHVPPAATPDLGKKGKENRASPCAPSALPRVSWVDRRSGWLLAPPCPAPGSARRGGTPLAPPPQLRAPLRLRAAPQLPLAPYTVAAAPTTPSRPLTPHAARRTPHASVVQECGSGLQLPAAPAWPPVFKRRGRRHRTSTSTSCAAKAERNKLPKGKAYGRAVTARGGQRREGIAGDGRRSATTGGDGVRAFRAAPARRALW